MSTPQDEEARAALWREQQRQRVAYQAELFRSLSGSHDAWLAQMARWQPVIDWLAERDQPGMPVDVEADPFGLSDQVNV